MTDPTKSKESYALFRPMLKTRLLDERMRKLFRQGRFKGTYFSAVGQEATNVGTGTHMREGDILAPSHRQLGAMVARGITAKRVMAQVYSKAESPDGAQQHPCHFGDPQLDIVSPTGHVAIQVVLAAGAAYAYLMDAWREGKVKINWDKEGIVWAGNWTLEEGHEMNCAFSFFGDGATAKGDFHESLNFAGIHKLPVVYVCENNLWAESAHLTENVPTEKVSDRAAAYGMPGITIDGNDIFEVNRVVGEAVRRARRGGGPTLIECMTYRWYGHSEIDPADYRTEEEVAKWKERDPLLVFRATMEERGEWDEEIVAKIEAEINEEIDEAIDWVEEESTDPQPDQFLDVTFRTSSLNEVVRREWEKRDG
ncbi:thiamine pyrophosphate-dependent dehydrogenase E1 component subunit alpha [bacterium]|nr:thiamine pyrophosphate-dependent dehydrogenase E1 component subunit alpha [bacterium]